MTGPAPRSSLAVTFAGSGDAFGSGGRYQACIHLRAPDQAPVLLDCGATSLSALKGCGLVPGEIGTVFVSHLHGDHFGGLPFLILDGQFSRRDRPLTVAGPPGTADRLWQAMETSFPGSAGTPRRFGVEVVELAPGSTAAVAGIEVTAWEVDHPSGAPPLALRLGIGGTTVAYTGDTAWTESLVAAADGADLLIAEAYYYDKPVRYHLRHSDLAAHRARLTSRRIVLTHMSADMLGRAAASQVDFETARDGLTIHVLVLRRGYLACSTVVSPADGASPTSLARNRSACSGKGGQGRSGSLIRRDSMPMTAVRRSSATVAASPGEATPASMQRCTAVVDEGGHLQALGRMNGAAPLSARIAETKAASVALFRRDGAALRQMQEAALLFSLPSAALGRHHQCPARCHGITITDAVARYLG